MPTLTIDLPEETAEQLAAAGRRGTSLTDLVRQALAEILADETAATRAQRVRTQEAIDFLDQRSQDALEGSAPDEPYPGGGTWPRHPERWSRRP